MAAVAVVDDEERPARAMTTYTATATYTATTTYTTTFANTRGEGVS